MVVENTICEYNECWHHRNLVIINDYHLAADVN